MVPASVGSNETATGIVELLKKAAVVNKFSRPSIKCKVMTNK